MAARWWLTFLDAVPTYASSTWRPRLVGMIGLLRPPARGYCENGSLASLRGGPVPGGTRPTLFWRLRVAAG